MKTAARILNNMPLRVVLASLLIAAPAAYATPIATYNSVLTSANASQLGRPSRNNATPQDWAGSETYPGLTATTTAFNYTLFTIPAFRFTGPYVEITFNDTKSTGSLFITAYANSYDNSTLASRSNNWLGDEAYSLYIAGNSTFFDVVLPTNASLVLLVNNTLASGLNDPFIITVDDFVDTNYTDAPPLPEPSTFVMVGTGILGLAGAARRRFARA